MSTLLLSRLQEDKFALEKFIAGSEDRGKISTAQAQIRYVDRLLTKYHNGELTDKSDIPLEQHRQFGSSHARFLLLGYRKHGHEWFHAENMLRAAGISRAHGQTKHWGFAEPMVSGSPIYRDGYWRILPEALPFLRGERKIPKYAIVLKGDKFLRHEGPMISIADAMGKFWSAEQWVVLQRELQITGHIEN